MPRLLQNCILLDGAPHHEVMNPLSGGVWGLCSFHFLAKRISNKSPHVTWPPVFFEKRGRVAVVRDKETKKQPAAAVASNGENICPGPGVAPPNPIGNRASWGLGPEFLGRWGGGWMGLLRADFLFFLLHSF